MSHRKLHIRTKSELLSFFVDNIVYIEADQNYSKFHLADNQQKVVALQIGKIEERLVGIDPDGQFIRVGRSKIINIDYVHHINLIRNTLTLSDNQRFSINLDIPETALRTLKAGLEQLFNIS